MSKITIRESGQGQMTEKTAKGNELQRGERLQIMLDDGELKALDDFRYQNRMPSRAAAVRELLRRGLGAVGYPDFADGSGSSTYGVIDSPKTIDGDQS